MQYANITTKYICPADLHYDNVFISVLDRQGAILLQQRIPINENKFFRAIEPYKNDITIGCESVPNYYWLKDICDKHNLPFILGHAQYMWHICTKKGKDDKIDTEGMGNMMNTNCFPQAYAYPAGRRELRDLLRERLRLVRLRAAAYARIRLMSIQYGVPLTEECSIKNKTDRKGIISRFSDPNTALKAEIILGNIGNYDTSITLIEKQFKKVTVSIMKPQAAILQTVPGIGFILSITVLLEMHTWERFSTPQQFSSYCRVVFCQRISNGKITDKKNRKIGNPYLKWAFSQIAVLAIKYSPEIKKLHQKLKNRHGKRKAQAILRHKLAVAVYIMLKQQKHFNVQQFVRSGQSK